jgi:hypothetical protein
MLSKHKLDIRSSTSTSSISTAICHSSSNASPPAACRSLRSRYAVQCRALAAHTASLHGQAAAAVQSGLSGLHNHGSVTAQRWLQAAALQQLPSRTPALLRDFSRRASSEPGSTNNKDTGGDERRVSNGNGSSSNSGDPSSGNGSSGSNGNNSGGGPRQLWTGSSGGQPGDSSSNWLLAWLTSPAAVPVLLLLVAAELGVLLSSFSQSSRAQQAAAAALAAVQVGTQRW